MFLSTGYVFCPYKDVSIETYLEAINGNQVMLGL